MSDFLADRRRALENQFFAKRNAELLENLRQEAVREGQRAALTAATGIEDRELLDRLIDLGIQAETLAAMLLIPLLQVAWADRKIDEKERAAVLAAAEENGVVATGTAHRLLQAWLDEPLHDEVIAAWKSYVEALRDTLTPAENERLKSQILGRAESVARATGGILGLGNRISSAEQDVLDDLASAF